MSASDVMKPTDVKKIFSKIIEKEHTTNESSIKTPNYTFHVLWKFAIVLGIIYYLLFHLKVLNIIDNLGSILTTLFAPLKTTGLVLWMFSSEAYIGTIVVYLLLILYFNILGLIPWHTLFTKDAKEQIMQVLKWEFVIFVILMIPLLITMGFSSNVDPQTGTQTQFQGDTQTTWQKLKDGPLCYLFNSQSECVKKENGVQDTTSGQENYLMELKQPTSKYFTLTSLESTIPIMYNFQTGKSEGIYLSDLKCYQGKVSPETLIDTIEIGETLKSENIASKTFHCKTDNLKFTKQEEIIKIIPVLTLSINTQYQLRIPIYNYEWYTQTLTQQEAENFYGVQDKARIEFTKGEFSGINNVLKYEISGDSFPIAFSTDEKINKPYYIEITFSENQFTSFGKLQTATITKITPPKKLKFESDIQTPYELDSYKEKSTLRMTVTPQEYDESLTNTNDNIFIETNTIFEKQGALELTLNNLAFAQNQTN